MICLVFCFFFFFFWFWIRFKILPPTLRLVPTCSSFVQIQISCEWGREGNLNVVGKSEWRIKGHDKGNCPEANPLGSAEIHAFLSIIRAVFWIVWSKSDPDGAAGYQNPVPLKPKTNFGHNLSKVRVALLNQTTDSLLCCSFSGTSFFTRTWLY